MILGSDDVCWHIEGYPDLGEHDKPVERISTEACEEDSDHPFC
jgi:hypothetical protein